MKKTRKFLKKPLTLLQKNDRLLEINAMTKTSTRPILLSENCRLVQGSRGTAPNSFPSGSAERILVGGDGCARYCAYGLLGSDEAV